MPSLDVSRVLNNPKFRTTIDVTQNFTSQGEHGRNVVTSKTISAVSAVVTAQGTQQLSRGADAESVDGRIIVHTRFRLSAGDNTRTADTVFWKGSTYTVIVIDDYSEYGRGFIAASCDQADTRRQAASR